MKNTSTPFSDVIAFLSSADISTDQHREIVEVINSRVKKARKSAMRSFRTGDVVRWKSKWGYEMTGYVTGLGRTRVYVNGNDGQRWSVSASLLTKI